MRLLLHELRGQQRLFWRSRELAFFTFLLPIVFFVLLGSVYGEDEIEGVRGSAYLLAGMLGYGVAATAFAGLSILTVLRREEGILKRLRATPLPPGTAIAAMVLSTLLVFVVEAALLVGLGRVFFDVPLPSRVGSLVLVLLLGGLCFAALGLALTVFVRSGEGSSAVVNAIYLPMTFISGSFFSPHSFPRALELVGEALPLTHFIRLVRHVLLEDGEVWGRAGSVAVLAGWGLGAAVVAVRGFRWGPREG